MQQHTPLVSIIIPAHNSEKYISLTLDSILNQSVTNFEIIIVDDGSTDNTVNVINQYRTKDDRIKLLIQPKSGKPSIARNYGIKHAQGEYIAFIDSDDVMYADKLKIQTDVLNKYHHVQFSFHDYYIIDENNNKKATPVLQSKDYLNKSRSYFNQVENSVFLSKNDFFYFASLEILGVHTATVMFRKSCITPSEPVFDEALTISEDDDLWLKLIFKYDTAFINCPLTGYRKHDSSLTYNNEHGLLHSNILIHDRNFQRIKNKIGIKPLKKLKQKLANRYRNLAYFYYQKNDISKSSTYYLKSFLYDHKFRYLISYLKSKFARIIF